VIMVTTFKRVSPIPPEPKPSDHFGLLVDNALDFLKRSIVDFDKAP
jgi:hypothetical protein